MNVEKKRALEERTVLEMIKIYCRGHHKSERGADGLCPECRELAGYAAVKIKKCPRMDVKTFCSVCPIHCYGKSERERIQETMRYAGPRMLLHHPIMTLHHMLLDWQTRLGLRGKEVVVSKKVKKNVEN